MAKNWKYRGEKINLSGNLSGNDRHHLFNYRQVRTEFIKIVGEPKSDAEHTKLHNLCKTAMNYMPIVLLTKEQHNKVHSNIINNEQTKHP